MSTRRLHLAEGAAPAIFAVPDEIATALCRAGVVSGHRIDMGQWELVDCGRVGVARVGDVTVWVRPKLAIARLLWLIGYARSPGWREGDSVELERVDELVTAVADAFVRQTERALEAGLLQGYKQVDDETPVLRGRFRAHEQLARRYGIALPLFVRYDDYTIDIAENQILLAAASALLRLPGVRAPTRARLHALRHRLVGVGSITPGTGAPTWTADRLNTRYHDALWLAELVLNHCSVEQAPGHLRIDGFLVNMPKVFEDFVTATLGAALGKLGGTCRAQDPWWLDDRGEIALRPDLVWYRDGRPMALADAKYKAEHYNGFPNADVYQMLAYATALQLDSGHLVYAKGNEQARSWRVRNAGVTITAHTLDLGSLPNDVLAQVDRLAERIAATLVPDGVP